MPKRENISMSVIRRLPRYYRFLSELAEQETYRISSGELAKRMNLTASQVRQDFNCFGGFGQQGFGYNTVALKNEIEQILGLRSLRSAILIGVGNLGKAVANHIVFEARGFNLVGAFEKSQNLIGKPLKSLLVKDYNGLEAFCSERVIDVAILCIPEKEAETVSAQLYSLGIKCFWNFSHYDISCKYPDAIVENVHMGDSLMTLSYRIFENSEKNKNS